MKPSVKLKAKLLDLAIRGKLVAQDPNDEPADMLLARIRDEKAKLVKEKKIKKVKPLPPVTDDEKPFDLPKGWTWCRLGELIQVISGVSYQKGDVTTSGIRILRGGNIKEDARICLQSDDVFLPEKYCDNATTITAGDIVIVASTGSSTVIGRPAVAKETMPKVQIGAFLRIVRAIDDNSKEWLPIMFRGEYYRQYIREISKGTNINNLKAEYLFELLIPLPPLAEQKRIVMRLEELLKAANTLEECAEKFDALNDKARAKILDLAIRGKLCTQDPNDEPADALLARIRDEKAKLVKAKKIKKGKPLPPITEDEKPFDVPNGWAWCRLGEICEVLDSERKPITKSRREPGPYPYYGATNIQDYVAEYIFDEPLVLLGEDGAKWGRSECSAFCISGKTWVNNHAHVLRPATGISHAFLVAALESLDLTPYITGTTVPKLNQENMRKITIPLPPLAEQKRIVARVEAMLAACEKLKGAEE